MFDFFLAQSRNYRPSQAVVSHINHLRNFPLWEEAFFVPYSFGYLNTLSKYVVHICAGTTQFCATYSILAEEIYENIMAPSFWYQSDKHFPGKS